MPLPGHQHPLLQPLNPHRSPPPSHKRNLPRHLALPPRRIRQQSRPQLPSYAAARELHSRPHISLPCYPRHRSQRQPDTNLHRLPQQPRRALALASRQSQPATRSRVSRAESRRAGSNGWRVSFRLGIQLCDQHLGHTHSTNRVACCRPDHFFRLRARVANLFWSAVARAGEQRLACAGGVSMVRGSMQYE